MALGLEVVIRRDRRRRLKAQPKQRECSGDRDEDTTVNPPRPYPHG